MFRQFKLLFTPETIVPAGGNTSMGKEDMITFLGMDDEKEEVIPLDDKKEVKKEKDEEKSDEEDDKEDEKEEEEDTEEDELKEIEESLEEEVIDDEKLELVTPVSRKEILKKYPTLFKDFPHLEKAYYRNYQFTELFPTLDEAKLSLEKAETLDKFDQDLLSGNTENILAAAKKSDPKAFNKIVDNYMSTLATIDKDAYFHVLGNSIKQTIISMVREGRKSDDESLQNAAAILNKFVFGTTEFEPPKNLSVKEDKDDSKEKELESKQNEFAKQRFETANNDLNRVVENSLKATIDANLDPKNSMTGFVKKAASREVLEKLENVLSSDRQFQILVDKLWDNAAKNNYSKDSTDKIRNAFFAKAKTVLPALIKGARIEALRGTGKRSVDKEEKEEKVDRPERKERSSSDNSNAKKGEIPKGMSTLEYLMKD